MYECSSSVSCATPLKFYSRPVTNLLKQMHVTMFMNAAVFCDIIKCDSDGD